MKLLFVIDSLRFGGAERQLVELVKGLDKTRFTITVVSLKMERDSYAKAIEGLGVELLYIERLARFDLTPVFRIAQLIKRLNIDVVHATLTMGGVFGVAAAKLTSTPVVCSVIREGKDPNTKLRIFRKMLAPFSDLYVSNSYAGLANRFKKMRPNFRVVHNGFDLSRFRSRTEQERLAVRRSIGVPLNALVVGMVASLSPYKDQRTLLRSVADLKQHYPNIFLVFVGDGVERDALVKLTQELELEESVLFLGYRSDVDEVIHSFDVSVLLSNPKQHLEGISNSLAESMANRIPVVASRGGGTDELVEDGISGLLVDPLSQADTVCALLKLFQSPSLSDILARNAAARISKEFSLDKYVDTYAGFYVELALRYGKNKCSGSKP